MSGEITELVETLVEAGASPQVILAAVRKAEQQKDGALEEGREKARDRWRKWKSGQTANGGKRLQTLANVDKRLNARGEDNNLPTEITGKEKKKDTAPAARVDLDAFKSVLSDLDPERLDAIIKHRKAKRGQLTGHAAKLFLADAAACGLSAAEAVDTCISRNWITIKPDWLAKQQPRAGAPPNGRPTPFDALRELQAKGLIPDEPEQLHRANGDDQRLPAIAGGGHSGAVVDLRPGAFRRVRPGDF